MTPIDAMSARPDIRPTPPALSRGQLARLPLRELLERVAMLRNADPLTMELAVRLEAMAAAPHAARDPPA